MDRFVRGEDVPDEALREVWQNTTVVDIGWGRPIYEEFFRAVRALVIYGGGHFPRIVPETLVSFVEEPGDTRAFTVWADMDTNLPALQADIAAWTALVAEDVPAGARAVPRRRVHGDANEPVEGVSAAARRAGSGRAAEAILRRADAQVVSWT